jgi:signal transduction histidine kinase
VTLAAAGRPCHFSRPPFVIQMTMNREASSPARRRRFDLAPCRAAPDAAGARLVAAADEARRRLERDLHDGAQQQLVLAAVTLARAQAQVRGTPAEETVADALAQLNRSIAELRNLARGIHPAVLSERGLAAALEGLVARSPVPIELRVPHVRLAPAVEAAIYFTVAEALTNVARHARATLARVEIEAEGGSVNALIADNGRGGADVTAGSGLRGLSDRLAALGGTLAVESSPGAGTTIRAGVAAQPDASRSALGLDGRDGLHRGAAVGAAPPRQHEPGHRAREREGRRDTDRGREAVGESLR